MDSQNITLVFGEGESTSWETINSSSGLVFTTSSIPTAGRCLNVRNLFQGNSTSGVAGSADDEFAWQIDNVDRYNPGGNYSQVWYRQHVANPADDRYGTGNFAYRSATVYSGEDCLEAGEANDDASTLLPWY